METLHRAGRKDEAAEVARRLPVVPEVPHVEIAVCAATLAMCGAEEEARERLRALESQRVPGDSLPLWRAAVHAAPGEID